MTAGTTDSAPPPRPNERGTIARYLSRRNLTIAAGAVAVVIVLVLVVRYRGGRERRRYDAILKASLDHLVTAQEGFYYDSTHYATALRALPGVQMPAGVNVQLFNPDRRSWWGIATHDRFPGRRCVVWVGTPPRMLPADARAPEDETRPRCYDADQLSHLPVAAAAHHS